MANYCASRNYFFHPCARRRLSYTRVNQSLPTVENVCKCSSSKINGRRTEAKWQISFGHCRITAKGNVQKKGFFGEVQYRNVCSWRVNPKRCWGWKRCERYIIDHLLGTSEWKERLVVLQNILQIFVYMQKQKQNGIVKDVGIKCNDSMTWKDCD